MKKYLEKTTLIVKTEALPVVSLAIAMPAKLSAWLLVYFSDSAVVEVVYCTNKPRADITLTHIHTLPLSHYPLAKRIVDELSAYWKNPHFVFQLPLLPRGTAYQQKVWALMRSIPVGQTITYGQASDKLQSSPRAIGGACGANPIPLFIPCHRIVAKRGLGGFSHQRDGKMLTIKHYLLKHEGAI